MPKVTWILTEGTFNCKWGIDNKEEFWETIKFLPLPDSSIQFTQKIPVRGLPIHIVKYSNNGLFMGLPFLMCN